jgi:hypothetical protein
MSDRAKEKRAGARRSPRAWMLLGLLLLGALGPPGARGEDWSTGAGALLGLGIDSNPLEALTPADARTDGFARLESGFWMRSGVTPGASAASFGLRWAVDRYVRERTETRLMVSGRAGWRRIFAGGTLGASYATYARSFPANDVRNVQRHELQLSGERRLPGGELLRARILGMALDGRPGGPRDRRAGTLRIELLGAPGGSWSTRAAFEGGLTRIERPALHRSPNGQFTAGGEKQRDRWLWVGATVRAPGPPYVELGWGVRRVLSNSYGYSLGRLEANLLLGGMLAGSLSGQALFQVELPLYDDARVPIDPLEDPEDPTFGARNGFTLRLLRPLAQSLSAEMQATWHRDEALILRDFYRKAVWVLGIRYAAGEPDPGGP